MIELQVKAQIISVLLFIIYYYLLETNPEHSHCMVWMQREKVGQRDSEALRALCFPQWSLVSIILLFHPDGLWLACTVSQYSTNLGFW